MCNKVKHEFPCYIFVLKILPLKYVFLYFQTRPKNVISSSCKRCSEMSRMTVILAIRDISITSWLIWTARINAQSWNPDPSYFLSKFLIEGQRCCETYPGWCPIYEFLWIGSNPVNPDLAFYMCYKSTLKQQPLVFSIYIYIRLGSSPSRDKRPTPRHCTQISYTYSP